GAIRTPAARTTVVTTLNMAQRRNMSPSKRNARTDAGLDTVSSELLTNFKSLHDNRSKHCEVVTNPHRRVDRAAECVEPSFKYRERQRVPRRQKLTSPFPRRTA